MPNNYSHLFLNNPKGVSGIFNISRGRSIEDVPEEVDRPRNYANQRARFADSYSRFVSKREERQAARTLDVPEHIDYVKVKFLVLFDDQAPRRTISTFRRRFGLSPVYYEDFNKTVTFAITDEEIFENFTGLLLEFVRSGDRNNVADEQRILTIIHDFEFITTSDITRYINEEAVLFELYASSEVIAKLNRINSNLERYLQALKAEFPDLKYSYLVGSNFLEIKNISLPLVRRLVDNFDVFHRAQTLKMPRVRPTEEGLEVRDYGFEAVLIEDAPLVGVLDTGVRRIAPLENIVHDLGYDVTSSVPASTTDLSGHGTSVAGLVALGQDFYKNVGSPTYTAFAKIVPIKILRNSEGTISINDVVNVIRRAHHEHGIQLFNLSVNDSSSKFYNASVSEYGYALDKLSFELDILIFISAGNLDGEDVRNLKNDTFNPLHVYPNHFYNPFTCSEFHACEQTNINPPADSYNNISVGAIADNLRDGVTDMTIDKDLPAFYTRKFHYDYSKKVNGNLLQQNQSNFKIFKPDLVLPGGDALSASSNMQVLGLGNAPKTFYVFGSGTSFSTPLATNIAAKIIRKYPALNMQSVKALMVNSSSLEYDSTFLSDTIERIKEQGANEMFGKDVEELSNKEKRRLNAVLEYPSG